MRNIILPLLLLIATLPALAQKTPKTITADTATQALMWPTNLWAVEGDNIVAALDLSKSQSVMKTNSIPVDDLFDFFVGQYEIPFAITKGGTGATNALGARAALGLGEWTTNASPPATVTLPLAVTDGGTGATTPGGARTALGLDVGAPGATGTNLLTLGGAIPLTLGGVGATTAAGARTTLGVPAATGGTMTSATVSGTIGAGIGSSMVVDTNAGVVIYDSGGSPLLGIVNGRGAFSDNWPVIVDATDNYSPRYSVAVSNTSPSAGAVLNRGTADYRYGVPTTFSKTGLVQAASAAVARNALGFDAATPSAIGTSVVATASAGTLRSLIGLDIGTPGIIGTNLLTSTTSAGARTILGISAGSVFNVKTDYSAVGNGIADDTTAIVNALAGVTDGGNLYFPAGTYLVNTNRLYLEGKSIQITGDRGQTIIKNPNAVSANDRGIVMQSVISPSTYTLLTSSIYESQQARTISVVNGALFAVGDYAWLADDARSTNWANNTDYANKQIVRVEGVSGNTITIDRPPRASFRCSYNARLAKSVNGFTTVQVKDIIMDGYGFDMIGLVDSTFDNVRVQNANTTKMFQAYHCSNLSLLGCSAERSPNKTPPSTSYGFSLNTCYDSVIDRFYSRGNAECNLTYRCVGTQMTRCIFDGTQDFNIHGVNERDTLISGCLFNNSYLVVNAGAEIGMRNAIIQGCTFRGSFGSVGKISSSTVTPISPTFLSYCLSLQSNGGIEHGTPVTFSGTLPTQIAPYQTYWLGAAATTNVSISLTRPRPPLAVTFDSTTGNWTMSTGSGFAHQDVCVLDGYSSGLPTGLVNRRQYYLAQKTSGVYYLSPAYDLANPTWNAAADTVTLTAGAFFDGDAIHFEGSGTTPGNVNKGQLYYLKLVSGNTFNLALVPAGSTIDITGSAVGSFYTCSYFSTDGSGVYAEILTPVRSLSGTLGVVSMYPIGYGLQIVGNNFGDIQSEGVQLTRFGNVLISGNRFGPEGMKISTPIAFKAAESDGLQFAGNNVQFNVSGSYAVNLDKTRNLVVRDNWIDTPAATVAIQGTASSTNSQIYVLNNVFKNQATRETVISTNSVRYGICTGGQMRGNILAGVAEQGSANTITATKSSVVPGTTAAYLIASSSLGSTINAVLNDQAVCPGDEIMIARSAAGAGDLVVQKYSDSSTLVNLTSGTYGYVRFAFDPSTWGWMKVGGATNTVGMP